MEEKQFYSVTTRKFTLRCSHEEWLKLTQDFYNEILLFYYHLFFQLEETYPGCITRCSNKEVMRELEKRTIMGRDKQPVSYPLPWKKVPLYFRRAAINGAIASAKSYLGRKGFKVSLKKTEYFEKGVTYYKGMYQDMTQEHIQLKVWNGSKWVWMHCRLSGNYFPDGAETLSPSVYCGAQGSNLLVPVKENVYDGRKAIVRFQEGTNLCSIQFTNENTIAVAVAMNGKGEQIGVHFFKGGNQYQHLCHELLERIKKSEESMGLRGKNSSISNVDSVIHSMVNTMEEQGIPLSSPEKTNQRYWMKLKHIKSYYAHNISKQIVDFSITHQAGIIILPKYDEKFTKYVMLKAGNWSPLHLSQKIREFIFYKAWKSGILVLEVHPGGTSSHCASCGAIVKKRDNTFECPNGHRGNKQMNTARNLGQKCIMSFQQKQ